MLLSIVAKHIIAVILGLSLMQAQVFGEESAYDSERVAAMSDQAEKTVRTAFDLLWELRVQHQLADTILDPDHTGVIGKEFTPLTTTIGYEEAKMLSTKPGWASWLVRDLVAHGIYPGAYIAVSMSGSFPALNIAVFAALQELKVDANCISSVGASSYGANEIGLTWPQMERRLRDAGILRLSSSAVALGGTGDRGEEWDAETIEMALQAVDYSMLPFLKSLNLRDAIKKRMLHYGKTKHYFCFINVGGGQAALGGEGGYRYKHGGWFLDQLSKKGDPMGVMDCFLDAGVPCLNLLYLDDLNNRERIVK